MVNHEDSLALLELRRQVFLAGYKGGKAHLASCYSCLEILYALYGKGVLRLRRGDPKWADRDRFILSKGHAGLALYAVLSRMRYIPQDALSSYLAPGSHIGGEPCLRDCPWVEATTGSLGHGLSMGVGMAIALQADRSPARVFVLLGDGECEEGTVWEAALSASAFKLDHLTVILDANEIQKMDYVGRIIGEARWREKWSAFGWSVDEVNGHDLEAVTAALRRENEPQRPRLLIAHTVKGKGVSLMENNPNWHFRLPNRKELKTFKAELGLTDQELE